MGDIVLSAGVRQNLLSLQGTAALMGTTQNRLATGKKVNSALDSPINFFTSQSLSNRASDLNSLLDSIGQAQKTLDAADKGISAMTKLVESAKSIAKQAHQAPARPVTYSAVTVTGADPADDVPAVITGAAAMNAATVAANTGFTINLNINGTAVVANVGSLNGMDDTAAAAAINTAIDTAITTAGFTGNHVDVSTNNTGNGTLSITSLNADVDITVVANATTDEIGLTVDATTNATDTADNLVTRIIAGGGAAGDSLTVRVNGGANQVITFGYGAGEVSTFAELNARISALSGATGSTTSPAGVTTLNVPTSTSVQTSLDIAFSDASVGTVLGLTAFAGLTQGTATPGAPDATRASLETDFNNVLSQITTLAGDTSYSGINLLNGDNLKVIFNEAGSSFLDIVGVTFDATGLGLSAVGAGHFQTDSNIDTTLGTVDLALRTLRTQASAFGSHLTTVQIRQDFTKGLINTLQTGADNLVLADTNEEGANMLALQTRQQLSTTALSLSAQADQAVLRLFG